ncbi:hypothetical protein AVEN_260912-1 [Araneus ventricosus]|uniref:Uncharacterized protein n=1 Tax=Araneus ventricosus TaxID=182803 RepID=A0A4Y2N994_ARAVE|nr:hypothetical protein AVEN_260912-1 [Araneus ventricosus]
MTDAPPPGEVADDGPLVLDLCSCGYVVTPIIHNTLKAKALRQAELTLGYQSTTGSNKQKQLIFSASCETRLYCFPLNTLTPKPAVTGHTTSIILGRVLAGCCTERGEKAVGRVVIKGTLREEMRDERPAIHISHHP